MARPFLIFAAALCLTVGFAACGDDDEGDDTVTETEVATETSSETTDATETTGSETTATEALPPEAPGSEGPEYFRTPSRNIGCVLMKQEVRCDIAERDWKPTPANEPCRLDYGNGISLNANGAQFTCAGDTTLGAPTVLEYGSRAQRGKFFCDSTQEGVTCSNLETGAGFFISRQSYRIF